MLRIEDSMPMKDNGKDGAAKTSEVAAMVVVESTKAGILAAAAGLSVGSPVAAAAALAIIPSVAGGLVRSAVRASSKRFQKKLDRWWEMVAFEMDRGDVAAAAAEIEERIQEDWAREAVMEATNILLGDIDEAAIAFLARLTALAFKGRRVPNERDKRAARLLASSRREVLEGLRSLLRSCVAAWPVGESVVEARAMQPGDGPGSEPVDATRSGKTGKMSVILKGSSPEHPAFSVSDQILDLFDALKRGGFALDARSQWMDTQAGPQVAQLDRVEIEFLDQLLR
jgi:hypothetical protein